MVEDAVLCGFGDSFALISWLKVECEEFPSRNPFGSPGRMSSGDICLYNGWLWVPCKSSYLPHLPSPSIFGWWGVFSRISLVGGLSRADYESTFVPLCRVHLRCTFWLRSAVPNTDPPPSSTATQERRSHLKTCPTQAGLASAFPAAKIQRPRYSPSQAESWLLWLLWLTSLPAICNC